MLLEGYRDWKRRETALAALADDTSDRAQSSDRGLNVAPEAAEDTSDLAI